MPVVSTAHSTQEALDSILTLVTHPSAGFTPIGLAAVANGIKATLAPLTHLEGLGDALIEANEDWQQVIEKAVEVRKTALGRILGLYRLPLGLRAAVSSCERRILPQHLHQAHR